MMIDINFENQFSAVLPQLLNLITRQISKWAYSKEELTVFTILICSCSIKKLQKQNHLSNEEELKQQLKKILNINLKQLTNISQDAKTVQAKLIMANQKDRKSHQYTLQQLCNFSQKYIFSRQAIAVQMDAKYHKKQFYYQTEKPKQDKKLRSFVFSILEFRFRYLKFLLIFHKQTQFFSEKIDQIIEQCLNFQNIIQMQEEQYRNSINILLALRIQNIQQRNQQCQQELNNDKEVKCVHLILRQQLCKNDYNFLVISYINSKYKSFTNFLDKLKNKKHYEMNQSRNETMDIQVLKYDQTRIKN